MSRRNVDLKMMHYLNMLASDIFAAIGNDDISRSDFEYFVEKLRSKMFDQESSCVLSNESFWVRDSEADPIISTLYNKFGAIDANLNVWKGPLSSSRAANYLKEVFLANIPLLCDFNEFVIVDGVNEKLTELVALSLNEIDFSSKNGRCDCAEKVCVLAYADKDTEREIMRMRINREKLRIFALFGDSDEHFELDIKFGLGYFHLVDYFFKLKKRSELR